MASSTEICNLALSHIGISKTIASLTERSQEAIACNLFYSKTRDMVLRDFSWPFAMTTVSLGLVEEDPNDEWAFSYRYPSDCLSFKRILSGVRNDTRQSRVPYKVRRDTTGLLIFTDMEDAVAEYVLREENAEVFPIDFANALAFRIAAYIAPGLTRGDPFKMGERALKMYEFEMSKARATAVNEEQDEEEPDSLFIRGRE